MLLQLSGVALVTGLARQRLDLVDVFERVWAGLLDMDAQRVADVAVGALARDDALLALSTGKINRTSRHQQAMNKLESIGLLRDAVDFGDLEESHPHLSRSLAAMINHLPYSDFEDVFVAAWIVPQARRRGAQLSADGLGRRITDLIEALGDATSEQTSGHPEPEASAARDGRIEGN